MKTIPDVIYDTYFKLKIAPSLVEALELATFADTVNISTG